MTFVDISERLAAERQLRESEERYRALFNSIDEGFCVIEMIFEGDRPVDYRFLEVNEAFARQTGLEDAVGRTMRALVPEHEVYWYQTYGRVALSREPERFENFAAALARHYECYAFPVGAPEERKVGILFNDVSKRKESEKHLQLMVDELNHRVKNTLAVVQALAQQTFKDIDTAQPARRAFEGRLAALSAAHNLLTRSHWEKASLEEIARGVARGCGATAERFSTHGPDVNHQAGQAVAITMALHELCTNALKYGALSNESGTVQLRWMVHAESEPRLRIEWREQGGPTVKPPNRRGFGSLMVEQAFAHEVNGKALIEFKPEGVHCFIEAPLHQAKVSS